MSMLEKLKRLLLALNIILQGLNLPGVEVQDNVIAPFVDTVTNLGVVMDSKLTCKSQVNAISRNVNRALYGLRSFRSCTTMVFASSS